MTSHSGTTRNSFSESDFGVLSMEDSSRITNRKPTVQLNSRQQCDNNNSVALKIKSKSNHFRMIVCGDSGIGKSALVNALSSNSSERETTLEPVEVFINDTCIVDTCGYGALLRAEVIFSNVKQYIEQQFIKTNSLFSQQAEEETIQYMVHQSIEMLSHVNTCLYLIMGRLKPVDIEYMRTIHELVNIIPVIIQPDLSLRTEIRIKQRIEIIETMESNSIKYSLLGYQNYQDLVNNIKDVQCPPFMLDYSTIKHTFHGLLPLKQALYQHQYKYLHYTTTEKFIQWRQQHNNSQSTFVTTNSSSSSSNSQEQLKNIRISQYISKRRHSLEREMLLQEKKLIKEFEMANKQRKRELILQEIIKQDDFLISKEEKQPMTPPHNNNNYGWILLSILLSLFICYQNLNIIKEK